MKYLTEEERKEPFIYYGEFFKFETCCDLSIGVNIIPIYENVDDINLIAGEIARFTLRWNFLFFDRLNGFSGIDTVRFNIIKN